VEDPAAARGAIRLVGAPKGAPGLC
jgi:hypothetical protein